MQHGHIFLCLKHLFGGNSRNIHLTNGQRLGSNGRYFEGKTLRNSILTRGVAQGDSTIGRSRKQLFKLFIPIENKVGFVFSCCSEVHFKLVGRSQSPCVCFDGDNRSRRFRHESDDAIKVFAFIFVFSAIVVEGESGIFGYIDAPIIALDERAFVFHKAFADGVASLYLRFAQRGVPL